MDELLTVVEISKILKTGKQTVYELMNAGLLPYLKLGSRKVRKSDLEKFMENSVGMDVTDPYNPKPLKKAS